MYSAQNVFYESEQARQQLRRCSRCLLPETMPFISFDDTGECSYCRRYTPMQVAGKEDALTAIAETRKTGRANEPDCLIMFSGGRDSSYGLHYAVKELGLRPLAYTYDWGMMAPVGMRNARKMCAALGVEYVVVKADVKRKLEYVRKNISVWLKRPVLGMVPLFMAGDKQFYYHANRLARERNLSLTLVGESPLEASRFKAGFCGVDESSHRIFDISLRDKLNLALYYAGQILRNPGYLNSSLVDSFTALLCSYFLSHRYMHIYRYTRWDEAVINDVIINQYGWERDPEAQSTWRIGDGTSAFYNYIYYVMAGITENDVLRSNQIREGMISREQALACVVKENQPRWQTLAWYADTVGFKLGDALAAINNAPKLYAC